MTGEFTNGFKSGVLWSMCFLVDGTSDQLAKQAMKRWEAWKEQGLTDDEVMRGMVRDCEFLICQNK